jgi:hypothetical protein
VILPNSLEKRESANGISTTYSMEQRYLLALRPRKKYRMLWRAEMFHEQNPRVHFVRFANVPRELATTQLIPTVLEQARRGLAERSLFRRAIFLGTPCNNFQSAVG